VLTARALHVDVPPFALSFWRWLVAFFIVLPFAGAELVRRRAEILRAWRVLLPAGIIGMGSYSSLVYLGLQTTTATNTALINAIVPALISALSAVLYGQRLARWQWAGILLSASGVLVVVLKGDLQALLGLQVNVGDLWVLTAVCGFVVFTVCLQRRTAGLPPAVYLAVMIGVAALSAAPLHAWELARGQLPRLGPEVLAGLVYVAIFPSVLSYLFWRRGVESVGPARAGVFLYLVPVYTTGLAILLLGERLGAHHLAGIGLIAVGLWLTTSRRFGASPAS